MIRNGFWLSGCGFEPPEEIPDWLVERTPEPEPDPLPEQAERMATAINLAWQAVYALGYIHDSSDEPSVLAIAVYFFREQDYLVNQAVEIIQRTDLTSVESLVQVLRHLERGFMA